MPRKCIALKLIALLLPLTLTLLLETPTRATEDSAPTQLELNLQSQQQNNWCWAAIIASVAKFYGISDQLEQCSLVNTELDRTDCCKYGSSFGCNQAYPIAKALKRIGVSALSHGGQQSFAELAEQIQKGHPVILVTLLQSGGFHYTLLSGTAPNETLIIQDPIGGVTRKIPYDKFKEGYQQGFWKGSFFTDRIVPQAK